MSCRKIPIPLLVTFVVFQYEEQVLGTNDVSKVSFLRSCGNYEFLLPIKLTHFTAEVNVQKVETCFLECVTHHKANLAG